MERYLTATVFGLVDLEMYYPDMDQMPDWAKEKLKKRIADHRCGHRSMGDQLRSATTVADLQNIIAEWAETIEKVLIKEGRGFYQVKTHKGKTPASIKVEIEVKKGDYNPDYDYHGDDRKYGVSSFSAPVSMLIESEDGKVWLPAWFVQKKLNEVKNNAHYNSQKYNRYPINPQIWPEPLKKKFLAHHFDQLPDQADIDAQLADQAAKLEEKRQVREKEEAIRRAESEKREAEERAVKQAKEAKAAIRKERLRAAMERKENVNVEWKSWYRKKGFCHAIEEAAENVTLLISGARTYILFPDGDEQIVKTSNVKIV